MKYVIDRKNNIEKVYLRAPDCEHCMYEFDCIPPGDDCVNCADFKNGCTNYKEISSGKIGMSFLEFISIDFGKIKKEIVEIFHNTEHLGIETANKELEKYLDTQPYYLKLLGLNQHFYHYIVNKDMIPEKCSFDVDVFFDEFIILQKIISAYADDKYFVEPSILLQALNEYNMGFCPSVYTPDWGDNFAGLRENPIQTIKDFAAECNKKRGNVYEFTNFRDSFGVALDWIISKNYKISRCENCGRFFVPYGRYDTRYCPYPFKNGKSCRELSFAINIDNNKVMKEYRKIYKTKHAWTNRNKGNRPGVENDFAKWHKAAKAMVDKYKVGAVSEMECLKWLEENK